MYEESMDINLRQVANGISSVLLTMSAVGPVEQQQIPECLLYAMKLSIMEELKKYTNYVSLGQILRTSLSSNAIGWIHTRLDGEKILGSTGHASLLSLVPLQKGKIS